MAEDSNTENLATRTDLEWRLETPADAEVSTQKDPQRVAIMEYKRKHLINPNGLLAARYDQEIQPDRKKFERAAKDSGSGNTYFTGSTLWVIKQAKGYQTNRNVNDVCLFDWDTMFILDFKGGSSQGGPTPKEGDAETDEPWPAGMLHQEQDAPAAAAAAAGYTFRSLLFAFLIRALKRVTGQPTPGEPSDSNTHDDKRMFRPLHLTVASVPITNQ